MKKLWGMDVVIDERVPLPPGWYLLPKGLTMDNLEQTVNEQEKVMARAAAIFEEHTREDGELWKTVDQIDTAHHIRHKAHRVYFAARRMEDGEGEGRARERIIESALDLINYCVFIVRQVESSSMRLADAESHPIEIEPDIEKEG